MNNPDLLRTTRDLYVLTEKPNVDEGIPDPFWSTKLAGLHHDHIRHAVARLRKERLPRADSKRKKATLKSVALQDSLARTLGAQSYDHWREVEQPKIIEFLSEHRMSKPTDLIKWEYSPGLAGPLTAQQVADRLFNSGLPLPKRIFTGSGSLLFAPCGYGRVDLDTVAGCRGWQDKDRYDFCKQHVDKILLRASIMRGSSGPAYIDMTGRILMLHAVSEYIGCMYNLLGSNLMDPGNGDPVMRIYNMPHEEREFQLQLFRLFRDEIESSDDGWVDVLPVPGNSNLIFLCGANGAFDWVVRDQRDNALSSNPIYPFFTKAELPQAMDQSKLNAHMYFSRGTWTEKLEHDAESRHYKEGGTIANWPGYEKLIERELVASQGYRTPRQASGAAYDYFVPHRLGENCLMVSPLVTITEFFEFCRRSNWEQLRQEKALKTREGRLEDLNTINAEHSELPVSVTWLDAVAYCRDFEQRTGLPVRLMAIDEWQQVIPPPANDSGKLGCNSSLRHRPDGSMEFSSNLNWVSNDKGLQFLSVNGFGEWLSDYRHGSAPAPCAATGLSIGGGPIERDLCPVRMTMSYKGKVGFRLCYVARPDA